MPISEGYCSLSSASTPDFFPSITDAPSDPIATSFGIENLWNILFQKFDMFLWMSGFQNPLVHTDFDMFVDE